MYGCGGVKRPGRDRKSAPKFTEHGEKIRTRQICRVLTTAARRGLIILVMIAVLVLLVVAMIIKYFSISISMISIR